MTRPWRSVDGELPEQAIVLDVAVAGDEVGLRSLEGLALGRRYAAGVVEGGEPATALDGVADLVDLDLEDGLSVEVRRLVASARRS